MMVFFSKEKKNSSGVEDKEKDDIERKKREILASLRNVFSAEDLAVVFSKEKESGSGVEDKEKKYIEREKRKMIASLRKVFNAEGFERFSNTPDYILAMVAYDAVVSFGEAAMERDKHVAGKTKTLMTNEKITKRD